MTWEDHNKVCPLQNRDPSPAPDEEDSTDSLLEQASVLKSPRAEHREAERGSGPQRQRVALDLEAMGVHGSFVASESKSRLHSDSPAVVTGTAFQADEGTLSASTYQTQVGASAIKPEQSPGLTEAGARVQDNLSSTGAHVGTSHLLSRLADVSSFAATPPPSQGAPLRSPHRERARTLHEQQRQPRPLSTRQETPGNAGARVTSLTTLRPGRITTDMRSRGWPSVPLTYSC